MFYIRKTLIKPNVFCHPCSWTNIKAISVKNFLTTRLLSKHFLTRGWILNGGCFVQIEIHHRWQKSATLLLWRSPKACASHQLGYPLSACTSSCELLLPIYSYHCLGCLIQVSFSKIKSSLDEWDGSVVQVEIQFILFNQVSRNFLCSVHELPLLYKFYVYEIFLGAARYGFFLGAHACWYAIFI